MTDHDMQEVSNCYDCPLRAQAHDSGEFCVGMPLAGGDYRPLDEHVGPQPWCPLRTRPILVRLVAKESK